MDTIGLVWAVVVHPADLQDRDGAQLVMAKLQGQWPRLQLVWADAGYAGQLIEWVRDLTGWVLEIVKRPPPTATSLRCCPADGWWSAPSPGSAAAGV